MRAELGDFTLLDLRSQLFLMPLRLRLSLPAVGTMLFLPEESKSNFMRFLRLNFSQSRQSQETHPQYLLPKHPGAGMRCWWTNEVARVENRSYQTCKSLFVTFQVKKLKPWIFLFFLFSFPAPEEGKLFGGFSFLPLFFFFFWCCKKGQNDKWRAK